MKRKRGFIEKYSPVLRWWFMFSAMCVGGFFGINYGVFQEFLKVDKTLLSFLILIMFSVFTCTVGFDTLKICRGKLTPGIKKRTEAGWFFSDLFPAVGFTGTLIGFNWMFKDFSGEGLSATTVLAQMGCGMSIVLYTTIAGIVCSILLKLQLFNISQHIDSYESGE